MARFDVFLVHGTNLRVVDVQADILRDLRTRIVIPLVPAEELKFESARRLRPEVRIEGTLYLLNTPELAAQAISQLEGPVATLTDQRETIIDAVDFLMQGF